MSSQDDKRLYRVTFVNQAKVYEVYAREVSQGSFLGFIEIEQLVFGEKSAILVDPTEEALKQEFENTKRTFIPMHSVIRIDEMEKNTDLKPRILAISQTDEKGGAKQTPSKITPIYTPSPNK